MAAAAVEEAVEHFEVWYAEPDTGKERHQKAEDQPQAVEIATSLAWEGMDGVTVHKVTTSSTVVKVKIPAKPEPEA